MSNFLFQPMHALIPLSHKITMFARRILTAALFLASFGYANPIRVSGDEVAVRALNDVPTDVEHLGPCCKIPNMLCEL